MRKLFPNAFAALVKVVSVGQVSVSSPASASLGAVAILEGHSAGKTAWRARVAHEPATPTRQHFALRPQPVASCRKAAPSWIP